jgi:two-component system chemotaxis response regulator CheY
MSNLVLVVDDSPAVRKFVAFSLRLLDCKVLEAMDGQDAMEQLARHPDVGLVVTDLNMPNMDGLTFIREVRRSPRHAALPIVVLSGENEDPIREEAQKSGATAILIKPIIAEVVQDVARQYLDGLRHTA